LSTTVEERTGSRELSTKRNTIDVDVGGTFTDMVMVVDGKAVYKKSPTTPHNLSECFMKVIEEGAREFDMTVDELAPQIEAVRYSTTVAMNRLIQRDGPRLGLITTEGHEDAIGIGKGAQWLDGLRIDERRGLPFQNKPVPLIPREMIAGVKERIDARGEIVRPLDEDDVRRKVRTLVDRGARGFVVSLLWSFVNPEHERAVRRIIREEYRDYHVGFLPVILSAEVVSRLGEYERTLSAVLDAYLQRAMRIELNATWDRLRDAGYRGPFLMVHNTGGCADVFKTTASRTYNGGPIAALVGSQAIAEKIGTKNVVVADVGGTSFDIGLVVESAVRNYEFNPVVDRWMIATTMLQSLSVGAGGGSIASLNATLGNTVEVGPASAGSYPGPAAYNLGGTEPTVTDADLVLGYLNAENYFGGRMQLSVEAAERAIKEKIADPLGLEVVEAAAVIRRIVDSNMSSAIRKEVVLRGYRPSEFALFAIGGGGPTHVAGYLGEIAKAVIFPFSAVFSAYGSSIMDVMHVYERSIRMRLVDPVTEAATTDYERFNAVVDELVSQANQELEAEGFDPADATYVLELDMLYGGQINSKRTSTPGLRLDSEEDVWALYKQFEDEFSAAFSPLIVNLPGGVYIDTFALKVSIAGQDLLLEKLVESVTPKVAEPVGNRPCYWPETGGWADTPVYDSEGLAAPGNLIEGPAIVETEYTTLVIPPDMKLSVDEYGLGILERRN
jgi:N-methylhydantoinase A/oxoprolinase/acetone carboxylase beta subunit